MSVFMLVFSGVFCVELAGTCSLLLQLILTLPISDEQSCIMDEDRVLAGIGVFRV